MLRASSCCKIVMGPFISSDLLLEIGKIARFGLATHYTEILLPSSVFRVSSGAYP